MSIRLSEGSALSKDVPFGASDTLKVILTTQEGKSAKRPHQAFLLLKDPQSGLETSYSFSVKETGKAKVDLVCFCQLLCGFLTLTEAIAGPEGSSLTIRLRKQIN